MGRSAGVLRVAAAATLVLFVAAVWSSTAARGSAGVWRQTAGRPVALQAVGAVGPGSTLTLQTASGPMQLTVDSQMNQGVP
jgi:hypothetical protein